MHIKTVFMLILFFAPFIIMYTGIVTSPLILIALFMLSGLGKSGIGMGVMHDAIHGSYSKSKTVNKIMGYSMNLIGANKAVWKIQHNVLHHTYTNIDQADDDINVPLVLRFSPHAKRYWIHKFQHFYVWFFYGISTLSWTISKDFIRVVRYSKMGFFKEKNEFRDEILKIIAWKIVYLFYTLVLPILTVSMSPWIVILGFFSMHFITGLSLSIVFQTAHIMPSNEFPLPDKNGLIANNWTIHQLATTSNYSPNSRFFSWLIGGLNYQIEHHLFPNVCHVHYKKLSTIVSRTAKEYGIPYRTKKTFLDAVVDHVRMLRNLGKMEMVTIK